MMVEDLTEFYSASARVMSRSLIRELLKLTRRGGIISFAGGLPDPSTFPVAELKTITTQVLEREPHLALQYGPTEGDARLRDELVRWMAKDGIRVTRDQVLITIGSQQGLDIVGRVFLDPGDVIVVERPSYIAALQVFRMYRVEMVGVAQDDDGMRMDLLDETLAGLAAAGKRPKIIYVVPDFQNPSGVTMSEPRRRRLLALALEYRTLIVEDNPYRELRFEGESPPPVAALDEDGRVIYLSTFSKTLCPGMRIAWVAAREEFIQRFVTAKQGMDLCCPAFTQAIEEEGVAYVMGLGFHADGGGKNTMRLNFSYPSEADIEEGIRRLANLVKKRIPGGGR